MITIVTYDITDPRRLNRFRRFLEGLGYRTQRSFFECDITPEERRRIERYCRRYLDLKTDSVRFYGICAPCSRRAILKGLGTVITNFTYRIL